MNRDEVQSLISRILEIPHGGELQVAVNGERRLATRFNDCAVSQNALKMQKTLTLTGRLDKKKASLTINTLNDNTVIERAVKQVFETCKHMPDDDEVMPAMGQVLENNEYAFNEESDAMEIETIGEWAAAACEEGAAAKIDLAGLLSLAQKQ